MTDTDPKAPVGDILIVDDTPDNLRLLSNLLTAEGYKVRKVTDAQWALQAALLSPPDLILLDIIMPGMNGYDVCRLLKASESTRPIPVIFLSVNDDALDKVQAFRAGGVDYITKPFEPVEVLVRVETQLKIGRLQKQLNTQNRQLQAQSSPRQDEAIDRHQQHEPAKPEPQFLNLLAQSIREPLSVVTESAQQLKQALAEASQQILDRNFHAINDSVAYIQQTLNNAILLAQAEVNQFPFQLQPLALTDFCQSLVLEWELPPNSPHQLSLKVQGQPIAPVYADSVLLQQILLQLLTNAIRYTPGGGMVLVELSYQPSRVVLSVRDEGIGIPPEEQASVFDRFYRASNVTAASGIPGAGLGLAIVQWAVGLHNGTATINSTVNQGTVVTVTLPLNA